MLLPKPLGEIAAADIRSLVENEIKEGDRLEYKVNLPKANDDERVKFLCTVASLANSLGGDIVIGIGERRDGNRKTGELLVKGLNEPGFDFDRVRTTTSKANASSEVAPWFCDRTGVLQSGRRWR